MLWLRQGLLTATVVLMLGAVFVAVTPFDDGPVRCGSPITGASVQTDASDGVLTPSHCGDKGVTRLVYATGLFSAALLATFAVLLAWTFLPRRTKPSDATGAPAPPPPPSDAPPPPSPSDSDVPPASSSAPTGPPPCDAAAESDAAAEPTPPPPAPPVPADAE